jgi:hypothetical protein
MGDKMQDNTYESTNPSGWHIPDVLEESERLEPGDLSDDLAELEPNDGNPLERPPLQYNPLNHAYPMMAETSIGVLELMVKFTIVRGESDIPVDLLGRATELQVPVSIEDTPVNGPKEFDESIRDQIARDIVSEGALVDELSYSTCYYLVPMIIRARRFVGNAPDAVPSEEGGVWESLTREEVAETITGDALLDLIRGYADKVASDPNAPTGLLDLLDHFRNGPNRADAMRWTESEPEEEFDEEWN